MIVEKDVPLRGFVFGSWISSPRMAKLYTESMGAGLNSQVGLAPAVVENKQKRSEDWESHAGKKISAVFP